MLARIAGTIHEKLMMLRHGSKRALNVTGPLKGNNVVRMNGVVLRKRIANGFEVQEVERVRKFLGQNSSEIRGDGRGVRSNRLDLRSLHSSQFCLHWQIAEVSNVLFEQVVDAFPTRIQRKHVVFRQAWHAHFQIVAIAAGPGERRNGRRRGQKRSL